MAYQTVDWSPRQDVPLAGALDDWYDVAGHRYRESFADGLRIRCYLALLVILAVVAVLAMRS
jgi:hypothetical protein